MNIIITGASRGIGFELVKQFLRMKGNSVVAIARNTDTLDKLSEQQTSKKESALFPVESDLEKNNFDADLEEKILKNFKKIDILINNAGALVNKPFHLLTETDYERMFKVNVLAPFLLIKRLTPYFNNPSHIVNIGSMGGFQGSQKFSGLSLYSASKGAIAILSECLAIELKEKGISVNCLALGGVQTEMFSKAFPGYKAQSKPEEMARFIADFALHGHKKNNGAIVPVTRANP